MNKSHMPAITAFLTLLGLQLALSSSATALPEYDRVRILQSPRAVSDAELIDQDGHSFRLSQLQGKVSFLFFGFTNCPDVCPLALESLRQLENSGGIDLDAVAIVMISVDGERDSPAVLKQYLSGFSERFIGLTGQPADVKPIAAQFSASFFRGSEEDGAYTVSHSPQVFVVDQAGQLRAEFYNASVEAMVGVTQALLEEANHTRGESRQGR